MPKRMEFWGASAFSEVSYLAPSALAQTVCGREPERGAPPCPLSLSEKVARTECDTPRVKLSAHGTDLRIP